MSQFAWRRGDAARSSGTEIAVLHVDDDATLTDMVAAFLERADEQFTVETATNAAEGLGRLDGTTFDCVVSDYDMDERNGIEFLREVRREYPQLPFILYTGKGSEEVASEAISAGVTDYLQKERGTSQYQVLANRIRNAVERTRVRSELADRERHLRLFFERSPLGVIEWDESLHVRRMNEKAEEILGYDEAELRGEPWTELVSERVEMDLEETVQAFRENDGGFHHVNENVRADGQRIVCEWHNRVVTDDDGTAVSLFSQFQDVTERRMQTRQLRTLIDNLPGMVYRCGNDPGWPMEQVGGEVASLTGYSSSRLEQEGDLYGTEIIHPEDRDRVWESVQEALTAERQFELTYRIVTKAGDTRWVWERGQGVYEDGDLVALEGFVTDVTDRTETTTLLSTLVETLPVGVLAEDESGTVTVVNDELLDLFGVEATPEEVQGVESRRLRESAQAVVADPETFVARIEEIQAARAPVNGEMVRLADGGVLEQAFRPIDLPGGEGYLWVFQDVTDRVATEEKLTALHDVADELTTSESVEAVCRRTIAASEEILDFDLSAIDVERDGVLEKTAVSSGTPPEGSKTMAIDEGIVGKTYRTQESSLIDDVQAVPEANPQGPYRATISIPIGEHGVFQAVAREPGVFDEGDLELAELLVTHAENALTRIDREQTLQQRNERLDDLASIVSHDLRSPLNVAQGRIEMAREETGNEHLDAATRAVDRSLELVSDVLSLARQGEVGVLEPIRLPEAVRSCWDVVETGDVELVVETEKTVLANRSRLRQLFENLFRNAVEHGGSAVTVTVGDCAGGFYVADDGDGIPAELRGELFDPGSSGVEGGLGLGLSIVRRVAKAHGWTVSVAESAEGGARFEVTGVEEV